MFYKILLRGIIADFYAFLSADINLKADVRKVSNDAIYTLSGDHFEIVGMRRTNLFQRFLPARGVGRIAYVQKNKFSKRSFSVFN